MMKYKEEIKEAVVVPGHAVYIGKNNKDVDKSDKYLGLFGNPPYKTGKEEIELYQEHVQVGCELAGERTVALLVFSGGCTRTDCEFGDTEGQSYLRMANQMNFWGYNVKGRVAVENYATDSFLNVLNSYELFKFLLGYPPQKITVVGFGFKHKRFKHHAETINSSGRKFSFLYLGVNDPPVHVMAKAIEGERSTLEAFIDCPLGNQGPLLKKRLDRDPHGWLVNAMRGVR